MATTATDLYVRRRASRYGWLKASVAYVMLTALAVFYGLVVAVLPASWMIIPATPILAALAIILWALPDVNRVPVAAMRRLMLVVLALSIVWPAYIAMDLPGLPWITPTRLAMFALLAIFLLTLASAATFRADLWDIAKRHRYVFAALLAYWATMFITIPLSPNIPVSIKGTADRHVFWLMPFFVTMLIVLEPKLMKRLTQVLIICAGILVVLAVLERRKGYPIWSLSIPPFLKIDPELLDHILSSQARSGDGLYRARGTFTVSLSFAEYLGLTVPFIIHYIAEARRWLVRLALIAAYLGVFTAIILTNSRLGMVAFFASHGVYLLIWGIKRWREKPGDIWGPAVVLGYPAGAAAFFVLMLSWRRLRVMTLGGGQHGASDWARDTQWAMGWPKIFANPIGHGTNQGGITLGFYGPGDKLTIDSWYLSTLLEYGIVGFVAYMAFFLLAALIGARLFIETQDDELKLAGPAAVALVSYIIVKYVLSQDENQMLAFMLVGAILGLSARAARWRPSSYVPSDPQPPTRAANRLPASAT